MPSTYTTVLKTELMETGDFDDTWGDRHAATHEREQHAHSGTTVALDGSTDHTLTSNDGADDEQRYGVIELSGVLTANISVIVPAIRRTRVFHNNTTGSFTLTVKVSGQTGVEIPQGSYVPVHCDGTNCEYALPAALNSIFGLTTAADDVLYATGSDTYATTTVTAFARTVLDDANASAMRTTLGLGSAATVNTGTDGDTIPVLSGANSWTATQIFNADSGNVDFRINGDTVDDLFFLDASQDSIKINGAAGLGTFNADGNCYFNKTSANLSTTGVAIEEDGQLRVTADDRACMDVSRRTSDGQIIRFYKNGTDASTAVGSIAVTSSAVSYNETSDYRAKNETGEIINSLEKLEALRPILYRYKSDPRLEHAGFIAHEAQQVAPWAVTGEKDAVDENGNPQFQEMDSSKLVPLLVSAVQELSEVVKELRDAGRP